MAGIKADPHSSKPNIGPTFGTASGVFTPDQSPVIKAPRQHNGAKT